MKNHIFTDKILVWQRGQLPSEQRMNFDGSRECSLERSNCNDICKYLSR